MDPISDLGDLLDRWTAGFAVTRPGSTVERRETSFVLRPAGSTRRLEYVAFGDPDTIRGVLERRAGEAVADPEVWLTSVGPQRWLWTPPAGLVVRNDDESVMTVELPGGVPTPSAATVPVALETEGARCGAVVLVDGEPAAQGLVGVVGRDAVFDRISTEPAHRRRGLARAVMLALTAWSIERGATTGILIASVEGRPLYERLGWRAGAHVATYSAC